MMRLLAMLAALASAACTRTPPPAPLLMPGLETPVTDPSPFGMVSWFPASTRQIVRLQPGSIVPVERFVSLTGARDHACWNQHEGAIEAGYLARRRLHDPAPVLVLHGRFDREELEACIEASLGLDSTAPLRVRLDRDGDITHVVSRLGDMHVGWLGDRWLILSRKLFRVREFLRRDGELRDDASMAALVARVDDDAPFWAVLADGSADRYLGVPTLGTMAWGQLAPAQLVVIVRCADAAAARWAADAIGRGELRPEVPAPLRAVLQRMAPALVGGELRAEVKLTIGEVGALGELMTTLP